MKAKTDTQLFDAYEEKDAIIKEKASDYYLAA
jgi:hypothetical protein